jgi:5-methylcytosine-specific restriction endonuclease McrA
MVEATPRKAIPADIRDAVVARQKAACARCGVSQVFCVQDDATHIYRPMQIDHILPIELGGAALDIANLQALCLDCHKAKTRDDIKRIRKAARLRRDANPETRRRPIRKLKSRGFQKADELK